MDALASPEGESARARARVAADTLLKVALADRRSADPRSGRGVHSAHATVARQMGLKSGRTVKRARDLLVELGFAVVIRVGRHLSAAEQAQARALHGRKQTRAASLRALTMPRTASGGSANVTPSRRDTPGLKAQELKTNSHQRAQARAAKPVQPPHRSAAAHRSRTVWPREDFEFARDVQHRIPALRRFHTTTICKLLASLEITASRWHSAGYLLDALERGNRSRGGWDFASADRQRNPLAYTRHMFQACLDLAGETPYEAAMARRASLRAEQARAQQAASAARRAAEDSSAAAEEFFAQQRRVYGSPLPRGHGRGRSDAARIVECTLDGGQRLYEAPPQTQVLAGSLQTLGKALAAAGWRLAQCEPASRRLEWTRPADAEGCALSFAVDVSGGVAGFDPHELETAALSPGFPGDLVRSLLAGEIRR